MPRDFRAASEVGLKEKLAQLKFGGGDGAEELLEMARDEAGFSVSSEPGS